MRALALALVLGACGGAPVALERPTGVDLSYTVTLDEALERARVEVCPAEGATLPSALVPTHAEGREHLRGAHLVQGARVIADVTGHDRLDLGGAPPGACVRYDVDLATCASPRGATGCGRAGRDLFAPTSVWLLAPERRRLAAHYALRFVLPEGVSVTPIADRVPGASDRFVLDERSFAFVGYLAFVHAPARAVAVPGGCIDVVTLDGALDASDAAHAHWLATAASASARVTGHPPFERLTAIVVPAFDVPTMPVLFGVAGRGVRPTVTLLVSEHATESALVSDWTAVHELAHFLTAYVEGEDTWLSEGLATYYEEVLRAREGMRTERESWGALMDGFERGRAASSGGSLRGASRDMHVSGAYTRVYWEGAALVFLADLAYRAQGGSLDQAVTRAWEHRGERTTADALIGWLDGRADGPLRTIARAGLDAEGFPDVDAALTWLGVSRENGEITLSSSAPGAAVRTALMNDAAVPASNPSSCLAPDAARR